MKRRGIPTLCCFKAQCDSIPCQDTARARAQGTAVVGRKGDSRMERHCRSSTARLASAKKSNAATGATGECWGEGKETQGSNCYSRASIDWFTYHHGIKHYYHIGAQSNYLWCSMITQKTIQNRGKNFWHQHNLSSKHCSSYAIKHAAFLNFHSKMEGLQAFWSSQWLLSHSLYIQFKKKKKKKIYKSSGFDNLFLHKR